MPTHFLRGVGADVVAGDGAVTGEVKTWGESGGGDAAVEALRGGLDADAVEESAGEKAVQGLSASFHHEGGDAVRGI